MLPTALTLIERSNGHLVGTWDNVFVTIWWAPATVDRIRKLPTQQERIVRSFPSGYGNLAILNAEAGRIAPEVRAEASRISRNPTGNARAMAQVVEGTGFGAAAVRSAASAMRLLNRSATPSRIFDELDLGVAWLMTELGTPRHAKALALAVRHARD